MYGDAYMKWKEEADAWQRVSAAIEAALDAEDQELRGALLVKLRSKYSDDNIEYFRSRNPYVGQSNYTGTLLDQLGFPRIFG